MGRLALSAARDALVGCVLRMKERAAGLVILCKGAGAAERGQMAVTLAVRIQLPSRGGPPSSEFDAMSAGTLRQPFLMER